MASLTGQLVAETYKALLKTIDNDILTASEKQITDGLGGGSNVFIDSQGFLRANKYKVTNGLATQFLKADGSLDANTYLTSITSSQIITALGYTPVTNARTLTINGTTYDLSANRSWTIAGTAAIWGNITGTLSDQTDLQTALNAKYNNPTGTTSQYIRGDGTIANFPAVTGFVPYTGATEDVDLGTHTLLARDLVIDHASASGTAVDITKGGSGIAVNIEKSGSGEALTVVKSSGSGNAASITGGTTLISELHLTTKLADAYISSAATWNAKQNALNGTGFVKVSGTTITYDNSTYLTTANAALTYLALTGGTLTGSITATSFVKEGGTSNEYLRADGSVNVITGDIISGSGTAGYIAKFGSSAVIASSNLFESGANIGFGTITLNYGSYGRAFTGAGFGSTSFGFEAVTGSTTNGALIGGLSLVIAGNDSTRRIGSAIQSYISGATSTHQGADLRFFAKPDNGVLAEIVRIASNLITFNKDLTAANITATTFVKSGGTASEFLMADGSVSTLSSPVTGSGSAGYIPKWTTAANIGSSIIYEDTSIGIAYTTPNRGGYGRTLSGAAFGSASFGFEAVSNTTTNGGLIGGLSFIVNQNDSSRIVGSAIQSNLVGTTATNYGADLRFFAKADGVFTIAEVARITSAGLRVYGTLITDGNSTLNGDVTIGTDKNLFVNGDLRFTGTDSFIWSPNFSGGFTGIYDPFTDKSVIKYTNGGNLELQPVSGGVTVGNAITAGSFVKSGGTSSQYLMANGSVTTFSGVTGSGTTNYVASWTISGSLGNSTIYDNGTNVGIGTNIPFNGINNLGLNIQRGGHSTLLLGDGFTYGGVVQSSDDIKRVFVGANIFDDPSNAWSQFVDGSGYAAVDVIGQGDGSSLVRLLNGSGNDSGYGGGNIFFESYKSNSTSYIKLRTNTDNAFYIFNSGNVGVNTTTDAGFKLDVNGTARIQSRTTISASLGSSSDWALGVTNSNSTSFYAANGAGFGMYLDAGSIASSSTYVASFVSNGISRLFLRGDGYIGINTGSPSAFLHINESSYGTGLLITTSSISGADITLTNTGSGGKRWDITSGGSNNAIGAGGLQFYNNTDGSMRLGISSAGNVLVGTSTDAGFPLLVGKQRDGGWQIGFVNGATGGTAQCFFAHGEGYGAYIDSGTLGNSTARYIFKLVSGGTERVVVRGDGLATFSSSITATSFFESSDFRLKKLIEHNPIIAGIENLQAKLYEKNGKLELGYFAQDAEKLMPYAVTKNADGFLNLSYREIHTAKIARLEQRVAELEKQLNLN